MDLDSPFASSNEHIHCGVCNIPYSDPQGPNCPRMLECGHTFCLQCLEKLCTKPDQFSYYPSLPKTIQCPNDRSVTYKLPSTCPINRAIIDMMDEEREKQSRKRKLMPEIVEDPIFPCVEQSDHESTLYCAKCDATYCKYCFDKVHSSRVMSVHQPVPVTEKPLNVPMCQLHFDQKIEFFCEDARCDLPNKLFCRKCLHAAHRDHRHQIMTDLIPKNVKKVESVITELQEVRSTISRNIKRCKNSIDSFAPGHENKLAKLADIRRFYEAQEYEARQRLETFVETTKMNLTDSLIDLKSQERQVHDMLKHVQKSLRKREDLYDVQGMMAASNEMRKYDIRARDNYWSRPLADYQTTPEMNVEPVLPDYQVRQLYKEDMYIEDIEEILRKEYGGPIVKQE